MAVIESRKRAAPEPRRPSPEGHGFLRTANTVVLVFVGCYVGATLGVALQFPESGAALLFPSYAVLAAALLLSPVRLWWLLVLGLRGTLLVSPWGRLGVGLLAGAMPASVGSCVCRTSRCSVTLPAVKHVIWNRGSHKGCPCEPQWQD